MSYVTLSARGGRLRASVTPGPARSADCVLRTTGPAYLLSGGWQWAVHEQIRTVVAAHVARTLAAALSPAGLDKLVQGFAQQAVQRFSQPVPLPLQGAALQLQIAPQMQLDRVAVTAEGLRIGLRAQVRPRIRLDGVAVAATDDGPAASGGFRLPLDIVIPMRAMPPGASGAALQATLPGTRTTLRLSRVPQAPALLRLGLVRAEVEQDLLYFGLRDAASPQAATAPAASPQAAPAQLPALTGSLDQVLAQASQWLGDGASWPPQAQRQAGHLGRQVGDFRAAVQAALDRLVKLPLGRGVQVSLQQPQLLLGAGRYSDGLIRVPAELSGFALVDLQLD